MTEIHHTLTELEQELKEMMEMCLSEISEIVDRNCYGAGYEWGQHDAIKRIYEFMFGEG